MSPLDEDIFTGFEDFAPPFEQENVDEDEGAHGDEDGGSSHTPSRAPSDDF
jgi:hypothetical protein